MLRISDATLERMLAEDLPYGDLTTSSLGIADRPGRMTFAARAAMTACCTEEAERLLRLCGCKTSLHVASGTDVGAGTLLLSAEGPAAALHGGWKISQNLIEAASGIAGRARRIVQAARAVTPAVAVACTRKNFPGAKDVSIKAILAGGAVPHRLGLSETILIFPEHRVFLKGENPIPALRAHHPEKKVVAEVATIADALELAAAGADVLQLEKFEPAAVADLLARLPRPRPLIAAAGGINEDNAAAYAATGADILVTSAPYAAKPADVKVVISAVSSPSGT